MVLDRVLGMHSAEQVAKQLYKNAGHVNHHAHELRFYSGICFSIFTGTSCIAMTVFHVCRWEHRAHDATEASFGVATNYLPTPRMSDCGPKLQADRSWQRRPIGFVRQAFVSNNVNAEKRVLTG